MESELNVNSVLKNHDIFLTGASGFIGTAILYKWLLLRRTEKDYGTKKIFVLVRKSKKYQNIYERLKHEVLANVIFEEFKSDIDVILGRVVGCCVSVRTTFFAGTANDTGHTDGGRSNARTFGSQ